MIEPCPTEAAREAWLAHAENCGLCAGDPGSGCPAAVRLFRAYRRALDDFVRRPRSLREDLDFGAGRS